MQNYIARLVLVSQIIFMVSCQRRSVDDTVKTAYIHQYGVELPDAADFYKRGGDGTIVKELKNGVKVEERYVKGLLHGFSSWSFPKSAITEKRCLYNRGSLIEESLFFLSGAPRQKTEFKKAGIVVVTSWYEDGTPRATEELVNAQLTNGQYYTLDNQLEGEVKAGAGVKVIRDGKGSIISKETLSNCQLLLQEVFHEDGTLAGVTPYQNGKIHGTRRTFSHTGQPSTVEEWVVGKLQGAFVQFENGIKIAEIPYRKGGKHGIEKRFKDGLVVEEISWLRNERHGPSNLFVNGTKETKWYLAGKEVAMAEYLERSTISMNYFTASTE